MGLEDGISLLVRGKAIEVDGVGRAIEPVTKRLQHTTGVKLTGIDEGARGPAKRRIHIRDEELGEHTFIEDGATFAAIVDADEVDYGANARIEAEAEMPVLPRNFAIVDLESRA